MKTCSEMELAVCAAMTNFQQDVMGTVPKEIRAHFGADMLLVRLQGVLVPAQQKLIETLPGGSGRDIIKSVRTQLVELTTPALYPIIAKITGREVMSLHHDISTRTGEEILLFRLSGAPQFSPAG